MIKIDIISDNICPWCYVGKKRLEAGIKRVADLGIEFKIKWHPFFLDTTLPEEGVDKMNRYIEKFGEDNVKRMLPVRAKGCAPPGPDVTQRRRA